MPSSNDINEAKRRVRQMQERAKSYSESIPETEKNETSENKKDEQKSAGFSSLGMLDFLGDLTSGDDGSKGLILALILILAKEKADNMLILALLYILL
ncbi:MAG: hypothetical protein IJ731_09640 [Eubacterium sp.]|nr:hypothetical protein [Eubacterium sp.]